MDSMATRMEASIFLSTPSVRRATCGRHRAALQLSISIHALREEGDASSAVDC